MNSFRPVKIKVLQQATVSGPDFPRRFAWGETVDKQSMRTAALFLGMGCLLALHSTAISLWRSEGVSALFVLVCALSAAAACYRRSTWTCGPVRRKWDFLASALSLWAIGEAIYAFRIFTPHLDHSGPIGPEFYFLVYGIPVLLAISSSNEERDTVLFVIIDSFQAIFAVVLVYAELSLSQSMPVSGRGGLALIYSIGSWILTGAALLRVLARPRGEERALYRILLAYLFVFALLATLWHGVCLLNALPIGLYRDLLRDAVFLLLTAGCVLAKASPENSPESAPVETNSFALVLNNGSPLLFTLAVLALGAMVAQLNFAWGISAIALSLMIYCFRAALLQSAYVRAQHALTRSQYALREANSRLKQLSLHDPLTGLPNRRLFDQALELEWNRAQRNGRSVALLLVDVDCFKALNDLRGHPEGDACLRKIAVTLQSSLRRAGEIAARYGGEEFAAILPDCDLSAAILVAESMRAAVLALEIPHAGSATGEFVTVSIGAANMLPGIGNSISTLIAAADEALYLAKRRGRNRVESSESPAMGVDPTDAWTALPEKV